MNHQLDKFRERFSNGAVTGPPHKQNKTKQNTTPLTKIINNVFSSGEWSKNWKLEHVVCVPKVPTPESEDDLRPISLTPFFSKVTESFVVNWLLDLIGPKIDFRQYGGLKGNSVSHYVIEFINFVLACQDNNDQTAVLACFIDFQKAFMRVNHNILIEKLLSDLAIPGCRGVPRGSAVGG